ncbi:MAG: hypothetical protein Q7J35_11600 [Candidatus Methanoperedens sp.]|nr:hypothetical protein [Candidatus Methanoperedens sp.]
MGNLELSDIDRTLEGTNCILVEINKSLQELTKEIKKSSNASG